MPICMHLYFCDFLEFWEDDGEIRMEDERAWFISREGDESEERNRASFSRWEKLRVISHHFTELLLHITVIEMPANLSSCLTFCDWGIMLWR